MVNNRTIASLYLPRDTALSEWCTKWDDKGSKRTVKSRTESRQRRPTAKGMMSCETRRLVTRLTASHAHWSHPVLCFKQGILCSPFFMQLQFLHSSCYIPAVNTHFACHPSHGQFDILPSRAAPQMVSMCHGKDVCPVVLRISQQYITNTLAQYFLIISVHWKPLEGFLE